ncbi:MAG: cbb3-type cytochrome c oxidase subunit I [Candidatus Rokubacteria bacterium]|nr:cbb3-type cytochrome c oxidase subunit I [Candidatus Rokubacteria bacterium]
MSTVVSVDPVARNDALIDVAIIRAWLASGLVWLLVFPTIGALVSVKLNYPEFLDGFAPLSFGRLRPLHVNGVIWGAFSTIFIALTYYVVPRLCGVPLAGARWSRPLLWVWNLNLIAFMGFISHGENRGWEVGEMPAINVVVLFLALLVVTAQCLLTIRRRVAAPLYVSLWYLIAALVWTDVNLLVLMLGPSHLPGINNAAWHGLFIHYVVGLWITPAGYVLIYFFLPAAVRAPIYSHKLSLIGFWSLAFFYPFVGIHHYLYSPIADWAETIAIVSSMMLIIPVWTVIQNFFGTMAGHWRELGANLPAKFLIVGSLMYLVGCFQGSVQALRSLQQPTHFTDFVVAHSHITVFGTFVMWAMGGAVYVWPRITRSTPRTFRLLNTGFWLVTIGIAAMVLILSAQGLQQGFMLMAQADWMDSVNAVKPFWWLRTLTGVVMDVGISLVVLTLVRGSAARPA